MVGPDIFHFWLLLTFVLQNCQAWWQLKELLDWINAQMYEWGLTPQRQLPHLDLPCSFNYLLFQLVFYQFRSDLAQSFVIYIRLHIQDSPLIYIHYSIIFRSDIDLITPYFTTLAIQEQFTRTSHFQIIQFPVLQCWCGCFLIIQHCWTYQQTLQVRWHEACHWKMWQRIWGSICQGEQWN